MPISKPPEHAIGVRLTGVDYPHLERAISWRDEGTRSEANVWSESSGAVLLLVARRGAVWEWKIFGWLGVLLTSGVVESLAAGKKAAVRWWGTMTMADRAGLKG